MAYVQERKNISPDKLQAWLSKLLDFSRFSQTGTPIISFALGGFCDDELLRGVSNLSRGEKTKDGDFKDNRLMQGKNYIYDDNGILKRIEIYKNGGYVGDAQIED